MSKAKAHIIYDEINTGIDDYEDLFSEMEEESGEELSDSEKWDIFCNEQDAWFDAEKENLNIPLTRKLIAIADMGLWNGRRVGYKILRENVNSIFDVCEDFNAWTCDRYNVRGRLVHHDGTHYVVYRAIRDDATDEQIERLCDALYNGEVNDRMIRRYTRSIAPEVKAVYGWK